MDRKIVEQLVSGKGLNAICRDLQVSRNRVYHVREKAREYGYLDGITPIPPFPEAIFPNPVIANTTIDRIFDRADIFIFRETNCRLKGEIEIKNTTLKVKQK